MRVLSLVCLLAVACNDPEPTRDVAADPQPEANKPTVSAPTGGSVFQRDAMQLTRELEELARQGKPDDAAKRELFERDVRLRIGQIDNSLRALDVSIRAESRAMVETRFKVLRIEQGKTREQMDTVHREIQSMKEVLSQAKRGVGELPAGFTEDELLDRVRDLESNQTKLAKQETEIIAKLEECQTLLKKKEIPVQEESTLTRERAVFQELRAKAQKLLE
ncbi:MAG: hypothetical protein AAGD14_08030 [Planctomycetota bacterium]